VRAGTEETPAWRAGDPELANVVRMSWCAWRHGGNSDEESEAGRGKQSGRCVWIWNRKDAGLGKNNFSL